MVGVRIRMRRLAIGVSQEALAKQLSISFQQVQKYERGMNRVSASKLWRTAQVLDAPVSFFFEGLRAAGEPEAEAGSDSIAALMLTPEGPEMARIFPGVVPVMRRAILGVARAYQEAKVGDAAHAAAAEPERLPCH